MLSENINVRGQLIPLSGIRLVLPNTAIAEIISPSKPKKVEDSPNWLLGMIDWRGYKIPLVSFERLLADKTTPTKKACRFIVLNGLNDDSRLPFYGFVSQGIPRLIGLNDSNTMDSPDNIDKSPYALREILVDGHSAIIPNQVKVEEELVSFGAIAQTSESELTD